MTTASNNLQGMTSDGKMLVRSEQRSEGSADAD